MSDLKEQAAFNSILASMCRARLGCIGASAQAVASWLLTEGADYVAPEPRIDEGSPPKFRSLQNLTVGRS